MTRGRGSAALFSALSVSIKPLHDVLKCINFKTQALVRITEEGLRVSVEDSRSLQAHAFLENSLFSSYVLHKLPGEDQTVLSFGISLAALMELLGIYNPTNDRGSFNSNNPTHTNPLRMGGTVRLYYREVGSTLDLILEENNVVTKCQLTTYEPDDLIDIELLPDPVPDKIIMKSEWLHDAITEIEANQTEAVTFRQSPRRPFLRLSSKGLLGSVQMDYPNDRSVLETFQCRADVKNNYRFSMMRNSMRAMREASKVSIRTDEMGTLSMQFMIPVGEGRNSFVDFRMAALDDEEEEGLRSEDEENTNTLNETLDF